MRLTSDLTSFPSDLMSRSAASLNATVSPRQYNRLAKDLAGLEPFRTKTYTSMFRSTITQIRPVYGYVR